MKNVPYHKNHGGSACALACYLMAAQYLQPDKNYTFDQFKELSNMKEGYVVWGFDLWIHMMNQGIEITNYDTIDYESWSSNGVSGLKDSSNEEQFKFYEDNTLDLEHEGQSVKQWLNHPNLTYNRRKPTWDDVVREHNQPGVIDLVTNSCMLNRKEGLSLHRVIILDITHSKVAFHDPNVSGSGESRSEDIDHFRNAFESIDPELTRYSLAEDKP